MKDKLKRFAWWLICPRMLKRYLTGIVSLITLVVLFYVEEDWRGARAWEKIKAELAAQGEPLTLESVIPSEVPDAENFCSIPLLAHLPDADSTSESEKQLTDLRNKLKLADPLATKSTPALGNWMKGEKTPFDEWKAYYLSDPAFAKAHPAVGSLEAIRLHFAENADVWNALESAVDRPYARFSVNYNHRPSYEIPLSHIFFCMDLVKGAKLKTSAEFAAGHPDQALTTSNTVFKCREALAQEPVLVSQLVNVAITAAMIHPFWQALESRSLTAQQLDAISNKFSSIDLLSAYSKGMLGENIFFFCNNMDYLKTSDFHTRANFSGLITSFSGSSISAYYSFLIKSGIITMQPRGWYDLNKATYTQIIHDYALPTVDVEKHRFYKQKFTDGENAVLHLPSFPPTSFWARLSLSFLNDSLFIKFAQTQSYVDMTRIACSLEKYYLQHHQYPASLDELVEKLPHDVMNGEPYHYQMTPDGRYKLWSVGWNEKDDGGKRAFKKDSPTTLDPENGDWVWSYTP